MNIDDTTEQTEIGTVANNNGGPWGGGPRRPSGGDDRGGGRKPGGEGPQIPEIDEIMRRGQEQLRRHVDPHRPGVTAPVMHWPGWSIRPSIC